MFSLLLLVGLLGPRLVSAQIAQTNATCIADYSWMGNSKSSSPCLVVAQLNAQCNYGAWIIPAIYGTEKYSNPQNQTATLCTCSWASYNLISACTACQGLPDSIQIWGSYVSSCSGKTTDHNYWPPTIQIPTDVKVPYWASTDPTTWPYQRFSPADAKKIYQASHADLPTSTSSPSKSTPVGSIVGGVIGGVVILALFILGVVFLLRRHRGATRTTDHAPDMLAHSRKVSDTTVTSGNMTLFDSSSLRPIAQTPSPANVQRSTSISSLPFFSTFIGRDSRATLGHTPIPQDPGLPPLEEVITPYTLPPTNDTPEKKHSDGEWPIYDQPSAPPRNTILMSVRPSSRTPPRKGDMTRYNPPAYTESDTATPSISQHQHQDSMDSSSSTPVASEAADSVGRRGVHTPAHSGSSMAQMGVSAPVRVSTSTFNTIQTSISTRRTSGGGSMSRGHERSLFRGRSRESFSPSEIA